MVNVTYFGLSLGRASWQSNTCTGPLTDNTCTHGNIIFTQRGCQGTLPVNVRITLPIAPPDQLVSTPNGGQKEIAHRFRNLWAGRILMTYSCKDLRSYLWQ